MQSTVGIGLLGCGTVGSSVAERLQRDRDEIERSSGVRYAVRAIAIQDDAKTRAAVLERELFTKDARAVVDHPDVDVVIELIGGTTFTAELLERALQRGRHVVTANKDLIGTQGPGLRTLAAARGCMLRFEAAVGGAIPVIGVLNNALAGDQVLAIAGVLNGTTTAVLSAMESGMEFGDALAQAQERGYAEADCTNDINGTDAAHKLAILCQEAFGLSVTSPRIRRTGIAGVTSRHVARARMLGYRIRLVAAALRSERGVIAEVAPVLVPLDHNFARTDGPNGAVQLHTRYAKRLTLGGLGAGGDATSTAVISDVIGMLRELSEARERPLRTSSRPLAPVLEGAPFMERLERAADFEEYPVWNDDVATAAFANGPRTTFADLVLA